MVILVRHAEKGTEPPADPPLTPAGSQRAQDLVTALADVGVTAIITSDRRRTRETAAPTAKARHLEPVEIGRPDGSLARHVAAVVTEVRRHPGGVVLVVGHTDTLPEIVAALGGPSIGAIPDAEFGNLFMLVNSPDGWRLVRARYGATAPGN